MEVVQGLGYSPPSLKIQRWLDRCSFQVPLANTNPPTLFLFEIHWHIAHAYRYPIDLDGVWKRSVPWQGESVRVLCPEDLLLQLSLHAAYSYFVLPWARWHDFARVIETSSIDWDTLIKRAKEWQAYAALHTALKTAACKAPSPALDQALGQLPFLSRGKAMLEKWVIGNGDGGDTRWKRAAVPSRKRKELINVLMVDRFSTAFRSEVHRFRQWLRYGAEPKGEVRRWRKAWPRPTE